MGSPDSGTSTFVKGSLVEASSKMDGLQGAWFVGKILETPLSTRRRSTRTMTFLVEFQSLLSNDGKELLRQHVSFPFLRPLPPPPPHEDEEFQVSEVVDAYHNDGWWVGVVCQVWGEEDPKAYSVLFDNPPDLIKLPSSRVRLHLDWLDGKWVKPPSKKLRLKVAGTSSSKRKRGECPKPLFEARKSDGAEGVVDKTVVEDYTTSGLELAIFEEAIETAVEHINSSSKAKDNGIDIVPSNTIDVNETISVCPTTIVADSIVCNKTVNQSSEGKGGLQDTVVQCDAMSAATDNMPCENQSFHFFESSLSLLSFIQSMDVFRLMPQTPHFRALNECNEILRDGLAMGQWLTFAKVAQHISQLQVDASTSTFNSIFECLLELESNGFDVKAMRSRLLELQSMKENQEELQTKLVKHECEIVERNRKETKIKAELDDAMKELKMLEEKMKVVEEKKTSFIFMMEEKDSEITKLKSIDDLVNEKNRQVEQNFKTLATSPW